MLWGLLPVYWKTLQDIPAYEILCHRMIWSFFFLYTILAIKKQWKWLRRIPADRKALITYMVTASILGVNWFIYIWAINSGYLVEASLGYFINPLVNVLLGVIILKERMRIGQWAAIAIAALGVLYLTLDYGHIPWIALVLAFSFGFYGLLRKIGPLNSLEGLSAEMTILLIPAVIFLLYLEIKGQSTFGHVGFTKNSLLVLAGIATALPLLFFASAARRIKLATIGVLQYISPSFQFLLGVFVYHEEFPRERFIGFIIIWVALLVFTLEGILNKKQPPSDLREIPST
jgi:chloramphenicol-sensitive protein RarD